MSSIIESGCPEATQEVSGVNERVVKDSIYAIAYATCPITKSGYCEYPDSCIGCYEIIDAKLQEVIE